MDCPELFRPERIRWLSVVVLSLVILWGCSSTRTAYRYADWGIVWWVEDYVTLTDSQKAQLNRDINQLRDWHCSVELPRYRRWLQALEQDVRQRNLDADTVAFHQEQLLAFFPPLQSKVIPIATTLLASLSDAQIQELADNMEQNQREREDEYLAEDAQTMVSARAERTEERLEGWLGSLNRNQKAVIERWSEERGRQTEIWLQGRRNWQMALLDALEHRHDAGFEHRVERLVKSSEEVRGDAYQAMMADSRAALKTLIHDVVAAGDASHLAHLENRATELGSDFEALTCSPGSSIAAARADQTVR